MIQNGRRFPCTNKKWTSFYSGKKCTALCLMSFDGFSALFALFTWKVEQFTVKMDHFLASQWLFGFSYQTTFWVFWFTQTSFYVHQKTQKVFWFEMPNSHCCAMKLNSHSALLNLLDSQCKTAENQSKLIAQRAVHFSRSWQHVPFWFFHGKDTLKMVHTY